MNVLIVDDNEGNRKLLRALLNGHKMETAEAADGVQALEALNYKKADVIITDILMPNMDGFRLCFEIRNNPRLQHIGVIMYTATDFTPEDEKRAFELGADKFLRKQGSTVAILTAIHETMDDVINAKPRNAPVIREYPELQVMKEYSQAMIHKLEERTMELENAKDELRKANEVLEQRVRERTASLEAVNRELEAFSSSVSHDLRAPLRWIDGYGTMLKEECGDQLTPRGKELLQQIQSAQKRMSQLIDDLLGLARVSQSELHPRDVDLSALAREVVARLTAAEPDGDSEIVIEPDMVVKGDTSLLRIALENLFDNAWKYSSKEKRRRIEFGRTEIDREMGYFVRDNGIGFDMEYARKLFGAFQRLHSDSDFPGIGIGLATVKRVIHRHGGRIWAKSVPGHGATFYFSLPK